MSKNRKPYKRKELFPIFMSKTPQIIVISLSLAIIFNITIILKSRENSSQDIDIKRQATIEYYAKIKNLLSMYSDEMDTTTPSLQGDITSLQGDNSKEIYLNLAKLKYFANWVTEYSNDIDSIPTKNVDKEMVEYFAILSESMRLSARLIEDYSNSYILALNNSSKGLSTKLNDISLKLGNEHEDTRHSRINSKKNELEYTLPALQSKFLYKYGIVFEKGQDAANHKHP